MNADILTSIRVYSIIIAIICESIRATFVWESPITRIWWLLQLHWAFTTPIMLASLVPSVPVAAVFGIITSVLSVLFSIFTLLACTVVFRCGVGCVSTLPLDLVRIAALALVSLYSILCSIAWWRIEQRPVLQPKRHLSLLILVGFVPSCVLLFGNTPALALPALTIDPSVFWLIHLHRPQTNTIAFTAVLLLCVFDILHIVLFNGSPYVHNILIFRTFLDVGRVYIRLATI